MASANLTITVDDEVLKRARIKALEEGTSVNALLARHLEAFVSGDGLFERQKSVTDEIRAVAREAARARPAPAGPERAPRRKVPGANASPPATPQAKGARRTLRDELYEERGAELDARRR